MTKKCSCCGKELPISEFYKNSASKDGYRSKCKVCDRATKLARDTKKKDMCDLGLTNILDISTDLRVIK